MKVIIVGTAYPLRGGIAHYNALLFRELSKRHHVEIVTFTRQYPDFLFPGKTQSEQSGDSLRVPSTPLIDSINPLSWLRAAKYIRSKSPDMIIFKYWLPFFGPCFGSIARRVKRGRSTRVLFICDNVVPHEKRPGDVAFTRYAFKAADGFIVQSDAVEKDLLGFWPSARYMKVPHPLYNIFGEPVAKERARDELSLPPGKYLLFFGYVRPYKGLDILLEAMAIVRRELDVRLMVVGEFYDDEDKYRQQIKSLALESAVHLHAGYAAGDVVGRYFSACDAVLLPYRSATQSGIAQIAYNFDKPVIATNVGGLAEVVLDGQTGFVVPPADPKSLAEAINRFYRDQREAGFVNNVRIEKQKYTWAALAAALEELAV